MRKVFIEESVLFKKFRNEIEKVLQAEEIEEGQPFVILQTVAIIGKRIDDRIVVEKMLPRVVF
ncbi:hypothetical protein SMD22_00570 (plasmid) [Brevibacillus halotolerans]|nr:hypothetical protein SMD22_00570 [Brevibacillus halotolerans]